DGIAVPLRARGPVGSGRIVDRSPISRPAVNRFSHFPLPLLAAAFLASAGLAPAAFGAKVVSDIVAADKRRESVDLALRLAKVSPPAPLPAKLAQPFAPAGFD